MVEFIYTWRSNQKRALAYSLCFILCEVLNFTTTVLAVVFTNSLANLDIYQEMAQITDGAKVSPGRYASIFPKTARCHYEEFGPSGTIIRTDALCMLPLNVGYERFYILLSFWYWTAATITTLALFNRVFLLSSTKARM